jgi:putative MATE family efflux protein
MTEVTAPAAAADTPTPGPEVPPPPAAERRRYDRSIVEGPLRPAVWKLAWPTMFANIIGGMQGLVDQFMVGHFVGSAGNAAIGVSWQVFLVIIAFIMSMFAGMSVLVARYAGANNEEMVDWVVYQAFLVATFLALVVFAPVGWFASPWLLNFVNASPAIQAEALPFLRIIFMTSAGMMMFYMLSGALRSAGDARTPMVLGIVMTVLNIILNIVLIRGLGPIPAFGTKGSAMGSAIASGVIGVYAIYKLARGGWVVSFPKRHGWGPDWEIIKLLFKFGLPTGFQGIAMNIGGVLMLSFIGSVAHGDAAQAAFSISYSQLFSFITWTSVALMGAAAAMAGQNLGAEQPERAEEAVHMAAKYAATGAALVGIVFLIAPRMLLGVFGQTDPAVLDIGAQLLRVLSVSGLFISVALTYTGGLQGTGDTKSPLYISIVSQMIIPLSICFFIRKFSTLDTIDIWVAILVGHVARCGLSVWRFNQGEWRKIRISVHHQPAKPA